VLIRLSFPATPEQPGEKCYNAAMLDFILTLIKPLIRLVADRPKPRVFKYFLPGKDYPTVWIAVKNCGSAPLSIFDFGIQTPGQRFSVNSRLLLGNSKPAEFPKTLDPGATFAWPIPSMATELWHDGLIYFVDETGFVRVYDVRPIDPQHATARESALHRFAFWSR
jgi:hypothetical protein